MGARVEELRATLEARISNGVVAWIETVHRYHGPRGVMAEPWPTGSMAMWVAVVLSGVLMLYFA